MPGWIEIQFRAGYRDFYINLQKKPNSTFTYGKVQENSIKIKWRKLNGRETIWY